VFANNTHCATQAQLPRSCSPAHLDVAASLAPLLHPWLTHLTFTVHMLELQLPRSMPHALPREPPFDFHFSSASRPSTTTKFDSSTYQMQLPVPRMSNGYELPAPRRPLTPPDVSGSAVKVVPLPPSQGVGQQYGYQLPAIGNSRSATATTSPTAQRQQQPSHEVAQTPRKKWSISPNLRIPSTINTPQEGLPQLAAEVSAKIIKSGNLKF
jgi:hypothetical protein